jgi:hypothetical protein
VHANVIPWLQHVQYCEPETLVLQCCPALWPYHSHWHPHTHRNSDSAADPNLDSHCLKNSTRIMSICVSSAVLTLTPTHPSTPGTVMAPTLIIESCLGVYILCVVHPVTQHTYPLLTATTTVQCYPTYNMTTVSISLSMYVTFPTLSLLAIDGKLSAA